MKILWKNVWYNLVVRQWHLLKYYWKQQHKATYYPLSDWSRWYYPYKQPWTKEHEDKLNAELDVAIKKLKFQRPLTLSAGEIRAHHVYHDPINRDTFKHRLRALCLLWREKTGRKRER